jgi:hypothetical protein
MQGEFGRNYADAYDNNQVNAFQTALNALGTTYTNNANVASQLAGINQQQYKRFNQPAAMANNYQQTQAPLQQAMASHLSSQALSNANRVSPLWGLLSGVSQGASSALTAGLM